MVFFVVKQLINAKDHDKNYLSMSYHDFPLTTFQAFAILSATSIGDTVTQCTTHESGVANALMVKVGQNHFFLRE